MTRGRKIVAVALILFGFGWFDYLVLRGAFSTMEVVWTGIALLALMQAGAFFAEVAMRAEIDLWERRADALRSELEQLRWERSHEVAAELNERKGRGQRWN